MRCLVLIVGLVLAGCQTATPPPTAVAAPIAGSFTEMLNGERAANGLGSLVPDARLARAAQAHARDMVAQDYFSHEGANGSRFTDRARAAGYSCAAAENIAFGQRSEQAVLAEWMASPGHRRNILIRDAVQFGLGREGNMWVLMLGRGC